MLMLKRKMVKEKKEIILDNYRKLTVNEILPFTYDCDARKSM
jgi:hypothetical protein